MNERHILKIKGTLVSNLTQGIYFAVEIFWGKYYK